VQTSEQISLAAVVVAVLAAIGTVVMWCSERRTRKGERAEDQAIAALESEKRAKLEGTVTELRHTQNEILDRMSEAIRAAIDPAERQRLGAAISLEMVSVITSLGSQGGLAGANMMQSANEYLVVKNLGPGGAQVRRLEVLTPGAEDMFLAWGADGLIPGGVQALEPGEQFYVQCVRTMADPDVIEVAVTFTDGKGEHQRLRDLTYAP
jgi:hypothetical protein